MSNVEWNEQTVWVDRLGNKISEGAKANFYDDQGNLVQEITVRTPPFAAETKMINDKQIATLINTVEATVNENGKLVDKVIPTKQIEIII